MLAASKTNQAVAGGPPPSGDPYWTSVSLLTNFENNLTFQDGSTNNFAITRTGTVNPSLNTPFTGGVGGSEYFNGASRISAPNNAALQLGSGNFTIELWLYLPSISGTKTFVQTSNASFGDLSYGILVSGTSCVYYLSSTGVAWDVALGVSMGTVAANTWYHLALVRNGTTITPYLNGVAGTTTTTSATLYAFTSPVNFGGYPAGIDYLTGFISNARIVKGTAVYTSAFTPPTAPLTAITNTSLLITGTGQGMFNNSTFVDQGPNALTVTATGAPVYSGLSPFGNTYPGSVLFSGSSQALTTPSSSAFAYGTGDFTWEMWIYPTSATWTSGSGNFYMLDHGVNGGALIYVANRLAYYNPTTNTGSALYTSGGTVPANAWTHIAASRASGTTRLYINGTLSTSGTDSNSFAASVVSLAQYGGALAYYQGHISNARLVKGTALYTANFTPSTTPLTAITNTSLLVRGDTGAFYDLSNNGLAETGVGTPVVTTQVKKFGNESVSLSSSSLASTNTAQLQMGTGDYTVEFWMYQTSVAGTQVAIEVGRAGVTSTPGFQIDTIAGVINVYGGSAISTLLITAGSTQVANQWYHIALTRSGSSTRLFINGTQSGSTATDSTNYTQGYFWGGANAGGVSAYLAGYLDEIRITKGVARYTATFTPPTATFPTA